jgi:5-methylcytosine-specific restriction enzyme subunit McrC
MGAGTERNWLPARCQELLPQLLAATGTHPDLPSEAVLARVRYTPITQRYQRFVRLSWQIARQRGLFGGTASEGDCTGVLLDVAELWELYVISVAREAVSPWVVKHGTHDQLGRDHLLNCLARSRAARPKWTVTLTLPRNLTRLPGWIFFG